MLKQTNKQTNSKNPLAASPKSHKVKIALQVCCHCSLWSGFAKKPCTKEKKSKKQYLVRNFFFFFLKTFCCSLTFDLILLD